MTDSTKDTRDWPSLAAGLFDALTGRQAEITYEFDDVTVAVPSKAGADAAHASWNVNGTLRIRTREQAGS